MMNRLIIVLSFVFYSVVANGQSDTVRVCTYNLLNYGNSANPVAYKNQRLQTILHQIKPSLQCFNEVSTVKPGLLDTLLKVMPDTFLHGRVHNTVSTNQLDGLFWKKGMFHLLRDTIICSIVRDIVAYDLYWDYPGLGINKDTIKLTVISAHLKASNTSADAVTRDSETQAVEEYLSAINHKGNILMMGDLNLYSSNERAFLNLYTPRYPYSIRLYDPANRGGNWDADNSFADVHTQSPRLGSLPDGGASGGLDSRFDFILVSDAVMNGSKGMKYIPGTYTTYGNDGQHFNKNLTDSPSNSKVSASIAQALYEMSDHLPVYGDFEFTPLHLLQSATLENRYNIQQSISVQNPFSSTIDLKVASASILQLKSYRLYTIEGRELLSGKFIGRSMTISTDDIPQGTYLLYISTSEGTICYRLVHM